MPAETANEADNRPLTRFRERERAIIDVTAPRKSRTWKGIRRHHKALPADEVTVEEGIPLTTVPRTIFDLAATESADTIQNLLRESEYLHLTDRLSLPDLVERYPGRRGVRKVRLSPPPAPLQRLDRPGIQALPGRLSLAG